MGTVERMLCPNHREIFNRLTTPQVPARPGGQTDFPQQHIPTGQTSPPQREALVLLCSSLDPLDFNLDGLALLVLSASFIPSGRCFS